ncbi:MAG TPA: Uma2 family endonuclease [Geminicoccaceae bacterium]|nr:Uma2 family endonuclease [Geminicoccaceae bacterium]
MTTALHLPDLRTPEAFVAWVSEQSSRYEMARGRLVMMAGASNAHVTIALNAAAALRAKLRGTPCRPYTSDFMVEISRSDRYYPDVSVACAETRNFTDRPVLVVEVLSESTERFDREVKLPAYLAKPGLAAILYLAQGEPRAWLWRPGVTPAERPEEITGLEAAIGIEPLGVILVMAELYEDVALGETAG